MANIFQRESTRRAAYEADIKESKKGDPWYQTTALDGADRNAVQQRLDKDSSDRMRFGVLGAGITGILVLAALSGNGESKPSVDRLDPSMTTEEVVMGGVIKSGTNVRLAPVVKNDLNDSNSCGVTDGSVVFANEVTIAKPQSAPEGEFVGFKPEDLPEAFHNCNGANGMAWIAKSQMLQINFGTKQG
jgi:hypothetical protein